jgi:hypothetical protein
MTAAEGFFSLLSTFFFSSLFCYDCTTFLTQLNYQTEPKKDGPYGGAVQVAGFTSL